MVERKTQDIRHKTAGYPFSAALRRMYLERGWVIANHKLVSFHAAFISSVMNLPPTVEGKLATLKFMFLSWETIVSAVVLYLSWHIGIAIHEMGHYVTAARLTALNKDSQAAADAMKDKGFVAKLAWYAGIFIRIPWGRFEGVKKDEGNFAPDAPYNLAVAASGPVWSSYMAMVFLPVAIICLALGLSVRNEGLIYIGRFFLAPGIVGLLDRLLADRGKVREFRTREKMAAEQAARAAAAISKESWLVPGGKGQTAAAYYQNADGYFERWNESYGALAVQKLRYGRTAYRKGISGIQYQYAGKYVYAPFCKNIRRSAGNDGEAAVSFEGDY